MSSQPIPSDRVLPLLWGIDAGMRSSALILISGSRQTLVRDLAALRRDFGCKIDWQPRERRYAIADFGAIAPNAIRARRTR